MHIIMFVNIHIIMYIYIYAIISINVELFPSKVKLLKTTEGFRNWT